MSRMSGMYLESLTPASWNDFVANTTETFSYTVPGAKIGDFVFVSVEVTGAENGEVTFTGAVSSPNNVSVAAHPDVGTTGLVAPAIIRIKVVPYEAI
jgi:hypothetical protein